MYRFLKNLLNEITAIIENKNRWENTTKKQKITGYINLDFQDIFNIILSDIVTTWVFNAC